MELPIKVLFEAKEPIELKILNPQKKGGTRITILYDMDGTYVVMHVVSGLDHSPVCKAFSTHWEARQCVKEMGFDIPDPDAIDWGKEAHTV